MLGRLTRALVTGLALVGVLGLSGFAVEPALSAHQAGRLVAIAAGAALAEAVLELVMSRRRRRRASDLELPPRGGRRIVVTTAATGVRVEL